MIVVEETGEIHGKPVLSVRLLNNVTVTPEMEAQIKTNWKQLYVNYSNFYFLVDITNLTMMDAFTLVPKVASLLHSTREQSREQVVSTGLIMSPLAQPLFAAVTALYPPERPVLIGATREEVWQKLVEDV